MSSLKDAPPLTPELEAAIRATINPMRVKTIGTESHERAAMLGEIDRLRAEVAELAKQRGDLAAKVIELEAEIRKLVPVLTAAVELACQDSWNPLISSKAEALEQTLRDCGFIVASESQPSEMPR